MKLHYNWNAGSKTLSNNYTNLFTKVLRGENQTQCLNKQTASHQLRFMLTSSEWGASSSSHWIALSVVWWSSPIHPSLGVHFRSKNIQLCAAAFTHHIIVTKRIIKLQTLHNCTLRLCCSRERVVIHRTGRTGASWLLGLPQRAVTCWAVSQHRPSKRADRLDAAPANNKKEVEHISVERTLQRNMSSTQPSIVKVGFTLGRPRGDGRRNARCEFDECGWCWWLVRDGLLWLNSLIDSWCLLPIHYISENREISRQTKHNHRSAHLIPICNYNL